LEAVIYTEGERGGKKKSQYVVYESQKVACYCYIKVDNHPKPYPTYVRENKLK